MSDSPLADLEYILPPRPLASFMPSLRMAPFGESLSSVLAASSSEAGLPALDSTYGAYLIASFFGLILYGLSLHQTYRYARLFPSDSVFIQLLVSSVMILETAHVVMTMHTCYYYLVMNYFRPTVLSSGVWSVIYAPILIGLITFISQLFFARRVFLLGPHYRIVVGIAMLFYVAEIVISVVAIYIGATIPSITDLVQVTHYVSAAFGTALVGDLLLTCALAIVLRRSRRGLSRPDNISELVIIYVVNTGLIHLVFNIVALIMSLAFPSDLIHSSINVVTTRIYANILLAVLNSRELTVSHGVKVFDGNFGMNAIARTNRLATQERWNVPQVPDSDEPPVINIKVTTERDDDVPSKMPANRSTGSGDSFGSLM